MPFTDEQLSSIEKRREIEIETRAGKRRYRTIIWIVVDDDAVFVRSVRGKQGKWYQRALQSPEVALRVAGETIGARAVPASDPASVERTSEALRRKYSEGRSLDSMLQAEILETTMRLDPS
ncbi:MAG: DUF2255 family protein [Actinobacteria bacterium]|nr:DUF2255 family protein [Actinomycetota bacterium]